jgi:predicted ATP-grasp superfamily ATP-dependent carboligase
VIDPSVPVVCAFRGGYGDVAIARSLGRLGVPMYLVAQKDMANPVWSSRYWAKRTRWDYSSPEERSVAFLLAVGATLRAAHGSRAILLTTSDWVAIFIERNRHLLQKQFAFPQPVRPVIHSLLNKWDMHLLAKEHDIPTPNTAYPAIRADVDEFLETSGFPIVVKPADPHLRNPTSGKRITNSRQELMDAVDRNASHASLNVVLQEYIPGDADSVWMCNGYFAQNREHTVTFTGKKLRQTSSTGIATLAICLPNETVATQTRRLMEGVGFRGCVGIGFRYDSRDGLYKLLDVNARVSGVFRLFAGTNEMDVVRVCYLDLTGQQVPETALQPGRKWMLEHDVFAALRAIRSGRLTVAEWIRSIRDVREMQLFAKDDPVPFLVWLRERVRERVHRGALTGSQRIAEGR